MLTPLVGTMTDARKPREDAQTVRQRVLDHAMRAFARLGVAGTSIQDVADAAGLSKQALLHHFPSKDDLRRAVLERVAERTQERVPAILVALTEGEGGVDQATALFIRFVTEEPELPRVVMRELLDAGAAAAPDLFRGSQIWLKVALAFIREGQAGGRFRAELDPEAFLLGVSTSLLATAALSEVLDPGAEEFSVDLSRRVQEQVRMIGRALLTADP